MFLFGRERRRLPILVAAAVLFVFGLGPSLKVAGNFVWKHDGAPVSWLPYRLLLAIPGLGALRAPVRVEYVLVALLVAATVLALARVLANASRRAVVLVVAGAGVLLATNLLVPVPTTGFNTTPASVGALHEIAASVPTGRQRVERARRLRSRVCEPAGLPPHVRCRLCRVVRRESVVEAPSAHPIDGVRQTPLRSDPVRPRHDLRQRARSVRCGRHCRAAARLRRPLCHRRPHEARAATARASNRHCRCYRRTTCWAATRASRSSTSPADRDQSPGYRQGRKSLNPLP